VAQRGKVQRFEPGADGTGIEGLTAAVLGPSGNLRAPALRVGSTWLVGFDEAAWAAELG
jgi:hypothetical protein